MSPAAISPIAFLCAACDILGLEWPANAVDEEAAGDVQIRFEAVPGLSIAIGHDADAARFVVEGDFEAASGRAEAEVASLALKANHLRTPADHCFSVDPASGRLTARLTMKAATDDLVGFCEQTAAFIVMAEAWRRMMDSPAPGRTDPLAITTWG